MQRNDLTIDLKRTSLFTGDMNEIHEDLEHFLRKYEALFIQLLSRGYNTILFHSANRISALVANFIRGLKPPMARYSVCAC